MIISPTISNPPARTQGASVLAESMADSVPNSATSANVRRPALAAGLRSRSSPINRPMARLVRKSGKDSRPLPCRKGNPVMLLSIRLPVPEGQLQGLGAAIFMHIQKIDCPDALRQGFGMGKQHGAPAAPVPAQLQPDVAAADDALVFHREFAVKLRLWEPLPPDRILEQAGKFEGHLVPLQHAIGFDHALELGRGEQGARDGLECRAELGKIAFPDGHAGGERMAAEFL